MFKIIINNFKRKHYSSGGLMQTYTKQAMWQERKKWHANNQRSIQTPDSSQPCHKEKEKEMHGETISANNKDIEDITVNLKPSMQLV